MFLTLGFRDKDNNGEIEAPSIGNFWRADEGYIAAADINGDGTIVSAEAAYHLQKSCGDEIRKEFEYVEGEAAIVYRSLWEKELHSSAGGRGLDLLILESLMDEMLRAGVSREDAQDMFLGALRWRSYLYETNLHKKVVAIRMAELGLYEQALKMARSIDNDDGFNKVQALTAVAVAMTKSDEYREQAPQVFSEALAVIREEGSSRGWETDTFLEALAAAQLSSTQQAFYIDQLENFAVAEDQRPILLCQIAKARKKMGIDVEKVDALVGQAWQAARQLDNGEPKARAMVMVAETAYDVGQNEGVVGLYFDETKNAVFRMGSREMWAGYLFDALLDRKLFERGLSLLKVAEFQIEDKGDEAMVAIAESGQPVLIGRILSECYIGGGHSSGNYAFWNRIRVSEGSVCALAKAYAEAGFREEALAVINRMPERSSEKAEALSHIARLMSEAGISEQRVINIFDEALKMELFCRWKQPYGEIATETIAWNIAASAITESQKSQLLKQLSDLPQSFKPEDTTDLFLLIARAAEHAGNMQLVKDAYVSAFANASQIAGPRKRFIAIRNIVFAVAHSAVLTESDRRALLRSHGYSAVIQFPVENHNEYEAAMAYIDFSIEEFTSDGE
jgi:tetratricopeptide (TPR) repeat protein